MNAFVLLFVVGGLSAVLYFGGLWWTVRQMAEWQQPGSLYLVSFALRLACLLCVVWLVIHYGQVLPLAAFFSGFVIVRLFVVRHLADSVMRMSKP